MLGIIFYAVTLVFVGVRCAEKCADCEALSRYTFVDGLDDLPECDYSHCFNDCGRFLNQHTSNDQMKADIDLIMKTCPDITHTYNIGQSVRGTDLQVLVISDNPRVHEQGEAEFKYVGNMHGNEVVGREILLNFAYCLCANYESDAQTKNLVDNLRIHILPSMNPDGYAIAEQNSDDWLDGRENANSEDLNRNFPDLDNIAFEIEEAFERKEIEFCTTDHLDRVKSHFREKVAHMQPESAAIVNWLGEYPFVLSANLHGGSFVANYPFDTSPNDKRVISRAPDNDIFEHLAGTYATEHAFMSDGGIIPCAGDDGVFVNGTVNGAQWYPVKGGMQDFNYLYSNAFEITLELGCVKFPKAKDMWMYHYQNKAALYAFAEQALIGVKGVLVDGEYFEPIYNALVTVEKRKDDNELECHGVTSTEMGEFWRLLLPGHYVLTVTKEGYKALDLDVTVEKQAATDLGYIFMEPN